MQCFVFHKHRQPGPCCWMRLIAALCIVHCLRHLTALVRSRSSLPRKSIKSVTVHSDKRWLIHTDHHMFSWQCNRFYFTSKALFLLSHLTRRFRLGKPEKNKPVYRQHLVKPSTYRLQRNSLVLCTGTTENNQKTEKFLPNLPAPCAPNNAERIKMTLPYQPIVEHIQEYIRSAA